MNCFNIVLFDDFETLDAFGPAEIIGKMAKTYSLGYFSKNGGMVTSSQQLQVNTRPFHEMEAGGILLIPGGMGTRTLVNDESFVDCIASKARNASFVLTVCTGSAILARTWLLNGRQATSNKMAFDWVQSINEKVRWVRQARWVADGNFYSSSGVSAGMDMTLGYIADLHGPDIAGKIACGIEYVWNDDRNCDPFAN